MTTKQAVSAKGSWTIDTAHSEISFKVKHLVITTMTGKFDRFEGEVESSTEDFSDARIHFNADTASINTSNEQRDAHLRSDDFFNAEQFPKLTFVSTAFRRSGENYILEGDLTIRDITRRIEMRAESGGIVIDPWGNTKAGFEIRGTINRKDFGLQWDALTEAGGAVVSNEIKLQLNIELHRKN